MLRRSLVIRGSIASIIVLLLILILFMQSWPPEGQLPVMNWEDGSVNSAEAARLTATPAEPVTMDDPNDPRRKLKQKLVHLDLKGMPPVVSYYAALFPLLKRIGVTGIVVEYEDMFPFSGILAPVANRKAYTVKEVLRLNQLAAASDLEVIPLVQTFGHLEFILKTEEFVDLREVPRYPQVLCPSNNKSFELVKLMVDQVLALHHGVRYLHIGSDEVYFIGMCSACNSRMERMQVDNPKVQLFIEHVKSVAQYVIQRHARRVMMWDDEFRQVEESVIVKSGLGDLVDIVVWNYNEDVHHRLGYELWEKYIRVFPSIWIGSAFKGADHPNSMVVNEGHYLANQASWVKTMKEQAALVNFQGIILTGWQRYDHFSVLCEIMTVAIPSLVSCMVYLNMTREVSNHAVFKMATQELQCGMSLRYCDFPGSKSHEEVLGLQKCQMELTQLKNQGVFQGWADDLNLRFHFSNPSHVENVFADVSRLKVELTHRRANLVSSLREVYPDWSVEEWMLTNFQPIAKEINHLFEGLSRILEKQTFPVRPLTLPSNSSTSGF